MHNSNLKMNGPTRKVWQAVSDCLNCLLLIPLLIFAPMASEISFFPFISIIKIYLYKFKSNLFILFLASLGLCCCTQAFSSCGERGATLSNFGARLTLVAEHWALEHAGFSSCGTQA